MIANRIPFSPFSIPWVAGPQKVFHALQDQVQEAFSRSLGEHDPSVRMYGSESSAVLEIDAPGLDPAAFEIAPTGQKLLVQFDAGRQEPEGARPLMQERRSRPTRYELTVPFNIAADTIDAVYQHGVLRVTVKAPEGAAGKIVVRAG
jgi:HSP20 family molecular chaperone IbpA